MTVSSKEACRFDLDCGPDSYCDERSGISQTASLPGLCTPRLPVNASCPDPDEADACRPDLFCFFERIDFETGPSRICRPRPRLGKSCGSNNQDPCVSPLVCDFFSSICRAPLNGLEGDQCGYDSDCRLDKGLVCDINVCKPLKKFGAECESESDVTCPGYCRSMKVGPSTSKYFCREHVPLGGLCSEDRQCAFSKTSFRRKNRSMISPRADRAVCNRFSRDYGVCAMYSKLKKRLGERCNRHMDLCDHVRGLSCRWAANIKTTVCQHYHTLAIQKEVQFCAIGSALSKCPTPETVCRYGQEDRDTLQFPLAFPMCYEQRIYLPPGLRCEFESARCIHGSRCRVVPGVTRQSPNPGSFDRGRPARYCVIVRDVGGMCKSKFYGQCRDGLTCVRGVCKKQDKPKNVQDTHSGFQGRCDKLPCAPGLVCRHENPESSESLKMCLPPRVVAGIWQPCGNKQVKEVVCKDGLVCRLDANGRGKKSCRPRGMVGAFCEEFGFCRKGLRCASQTVVE